MFDPLDSIYFEHSQEEKEGSVEVGRLVSLDMSLGKKLPNAHPMVWCSYCSMKTSHRLPNVPSIHIVA